MLEEKKATFKTARESSQSKIPLDLLSGLCEAKGGQCVKVWELGKTKKKSVTYINFLFQEILLLYIIVNFCLKMTFAFGIFTIHDFSKFMMIKSILKNLKHKKKKTDQARTTQKMSSNRKKISKHTFLIFSSSGELYSLSISTRLQVRQIFKKVREISS